MPGLSHVTAAALQSLILVAPAEGLGAGEGTGLGAGAEGTGGALSAEALLQHVDVEALSREVARRAREDAPPGHRQVQEEEEEAREEAKHDEEHHDAMDAADADV